METPNYDYNDLCTELRRKRVAPVLTKIRAHSSEQFGEIVRHSGEEFLYVLSRRVAVQTEFYDPVTLEPGQALYVGSSRAHAYPAAEGCDEAEVLAVMSSSEEKLMEFLLHIHEGQRQATVAVNENGPAGAPRRGKAHR